MAKKKCPECPKCMPGWLAAFGDLMSLLLCFFVLLLSMSTMDAKKLEEAIGSLAGALSVLEGGERSELEERRMESGTGGGAAATSPTEIQTSQQAQSQMAEQISKMWMQMLSLKNEINEIAMSQGATPVTMEESEKGFLLRLPAELLFKPGEAKIDNMDALLFLKRIAMIIDKLPNTVQVNVRGHTDNIPPGPNSPYRDNWELSAARAVSVVKELIKDGVGPKRLSACGNAEFKPIATNATPEGRAKNRRVDLYFFSNEPEAEGKTRKSILDSNLPAAGQ
ncbi:flagellar motor protein MotB [Hydrogenimonas cancrithermarum]|uniref:Chemotaxis protein MotB n=1 Tax=Hydrogenimonas cancrithermarum TaxID=2993563 RepID=A0ABM8FIV2_9BACT|nr:flagellar motor protein MotB [Hydrogenimonas cancrithermarum]BDY12210.1 chemotaxis protein MotB [Hydrogenimonas cancrithermarum]